MGKKVSIITVVYNGARTIEQTINSVINQTYDNIEYIIIDGASTDGTCEIIQKYKDNIAAFISESDEGLYYAMNKGIEHATGEIIGILNSDDLYVKDAVSKVVYYYNNHDVDVVYGNALWFDDSEQTSIYDCRDIEEIWYRMAIPHPATFVKRETYVKYGFFDTQYAIAADYDLMLRYYSGNLKFGHINETLTYFRKGGTSSRRQGVCIQEAREIALCYVQRCANPDVMRIKIQEYYVMSKFLQLTMKHDSVIVYAINSLLSSKGTLDNIVIFGIGIWGERCLEIMREAGKVVDFFADNNSSKWGSICQDIPVEPPEKLCNYKGAVIIATYKYGEEIRTQLKKLDEHLKVFTLLEWAKIAVEIWNRSEE